MRISALSDLHGQLPDVAAIPAADVLVIAGDVCPDNPYTLRDAPLCAAEQAKWLDSVFVRWLHKVPADVVLMIWGNHDFIGAMPPYFWPDLPAFILHNSEMTLDGLLFYGSPHVPDLARSGWALCIDDGADSRHWNRAPACDILITHGPPRGVCDRVPNGDHVGSRPLAAYLARTPQVQLHICGHIHEGVGSVGRTHNVSYVDGAYYPYDRPILQLDVFPTHKGV